MGRKTRWLLYVAMMTLGVTFLAIPIKLAVASSSIGQLRYAVTDLGSLSGDDFSVASAISDTGYIAGFTSTHAVYWHNGAIADLGAPPAGSSALEANGVNNRGEVVGDAVDFATNTFLPYVWSRGAPPRVLTTPGFTGASARGVNDLGEIAGTAFLSIINPFDLVGMPFQQHATVWNHGAITDLGTLGGPSSRADSYHSINTRGDVVGVADIDTRINPGFGGYDFHAALWTQTTGSQPVVKDLGALGSQPDNSISAATSINEFNQVVGTSQTDVRDTCFGGTQEWGFFWQNGAMHGLPPPTGDCDSEGLSLNNLGQVVGRSLGVSATGRLVQRPVIWIHDQAIDLTTLIPASSAWTLLDVVGINDFGQIVGIGFNPQGLLHAFLLQPQLDAKGDAAATSASASSSVSSPSAAIPTAALSQRYGPWSAQFDPLRKKFATR
jgi:uncharacterized membrane protein